MGVDPGTPGATLKVKKAPDFPLLQPLPTPPCSLLPRGTPRPAFLPPPSKALPPPPPKAVTPQPSRLLPSPPPQGLIPHPASSSEPSAPCSFPLMLVSLSHLSVSTRRGATLPLVYTARASQGHTHPRLPPRVQLPMDGEPRDRASHSVTPSACRQSATAFTWNWNHATRPQHKASSPHPPPPPAPPSTW